MTTGVSSCIAIHNVAVATDLSPASERALQHALAIARQFGATVHLVHIVCPSQYVYAPDMIPTADEVAQRDFDQLLARLQRDHRLEGIKFRPWVLQGEIPDAAKDFASRQSIDLLVVGTRGRSGIPRLLLGCTAQEIFHSVHCAVLTVGPYAPGAGLRPQLKRILYTTDLSHESLAAIPWVVTAVREWRAEIDVLHVCASLHAACRSQTEEVKEKIERMLGGEEHAEIRTHVLVGKPAPTVLEFAENAKEDLIVLGLKPERALYEGPFWSQAYEIVRQTSCPVLSVRSANGHATS
jgi:nucleotide-binding universal stress UspA family protein